MEERKDEKIDTPVDELESNEARRQRLLGVENDSKIHDEGLEITKGNFFANLWYKRKWTIIISAFFIILAIMLLASYIFKDRPDMKISYNGPFEIGNSEYHLLDRAFSDLVDDYDGDGKHEITITQNTYKTAEEKKDADRKYAQSRGEEFDENKTYSDDDVSQVSNTLRMSEYNFTLIDKELYDKMKNNFVTIEELLGDDAKKYKDIMYGECGIYLHKTAYAKSSKELQILPEDTIIAICKPAVFDKNIDNEIDFLKSILTYNPTEK